MTATVPDPNPPAVAAPTVYAVTLTVITDPPDGAEQLALAACRMLTDVVRDPAPPGRLTLTLPTPAGSHVRAADRAVQAFGIAASRAGWGSLHLLTRAQVDQFGGRGWRLHRLTVEPV